MFEPTGVYCTHHFSGLQYMRIVFILKAYEHLTPLHDLRGTWHLEKRSSLDPQSVHGWPAKDAWEASHTVRLHG